MRLQLLHFHMIKMAFGEVMLEGLFFKKIVGYLGEKPFPKATSHLFEVEETTIFLYIKPQCY